MSNFNTEEYSNSSPNNVEEIDVSDQCHIDKLMLFNNDFNTNNINIEKGIKSALFCENFPKKHNTKPNVIKILNLMSLNGKISTK